MPKKASRASVNRRNWLKNCVAEFEERSQHERAPRIKQEQCTTVAEIAGEILKLCPAGRVSWNNARKFRELLEQAGASPQSQRALTVGVLYLVFCQLK